MYGSKYVTYRDKHFLNEVEGCHMWVRINSIYRLIDLPSSEQLEAIKSRIKWLIDLLILTAKQPVEGYFMPTD